MSARQGVLVETAAGWRVLTGQQVRDCSTADDTQGEEGLAILACLRELSSGTWKLIVAPSASSTITARLTASDFDGVHVFTQQTLAFAVEEHLPWAAEEFTVQTPSRSPGTLALALLTDRWERLFDHLRRSGHTVAAFVPVAVLIQEALVQDGGCPEDAGLLFCNEEGVHFVSRHDGRVSDWKFWPIGTGGTDVDKQLIVAEIAITHPPNPIHNVALDWGFSDVLQQFHLDVVDHGRSVESQDDLTWQGARHFWKPKSGNVNLLVGRLAGTTHREACVGAIRSVLASVIIFCSVAAGLLWWKIAQFQDLAERSRADQVILFQQTFPGTPVPGAVSARFYSEHRRLVGERGGGDEIELPGAALVGLKVVLAAHQTSLRSQFEEINIADDLVEIEAKFRNHEDAARMVERLEQSGLRVDPPQLQNLDERRFGTRLRGRLQQLAQGND